MQRQGNQSLCNFIKSDDNVKAYSSVDHNNVQYSVTLMSTIHIVVLLQYHRGIMRGTFDS